MCVHTYTKYNWMYRCFRWAKSALWQEQCRLGYFSASWPWECPKGGYRVVCQSSEEKANWTAWYKNYSLTQPCHAVTVSSKDFATAFRNNPWDERLLTHSLRVIDLCDAIMMLAECVHHLFYDSLVQSIHKHICSPLQWRHFFPTDLIHQHLSHPAILEVLTQCSCLSFCSLACHPWYMGSDRGSNTCRRAHK